MYLSYDDFEKCIRTIIDLIEASGKKYNYICGVERGGVIPAAVLSYRLGVPLITLRIDNLYTLDRTIFDLSPKVDSILISKSYNVLMVDEIMESGGTAEKIENKFGKKFDWAVCVYNPEAHHIGHYSGTAIPIDKKQEVGFWWSRRIR